MDSNLHPDHSQAAHRPNVGVLQLPWMQNLVPFLTSLTVHSVIILLAVVFAKIVMEKVVAPRHIEPEFQTFTASMDRPINELVCGVPNVGPSNDPWTPVMQANFPDSKSEGMASKSGPLEMQVEGTAGETNAADSIVNGPASLIGGPGGDRSSGSGDGSGPLARFGLGNGGGAIGPHGPMFGPGRGGIVNKFIFVCDATGSMLNHMPTLKQQLQNAIHDLKPFQSFNIIFFYDGSRAMACNPDGLIMATPDNVKKACAFLEGVTPSGQTDPFPALEMAFRQNPQLIYLLSDGGLDDNLRKNPEVLAKIDELETQHHNCVKINTIMFDENSDSGREVLTQIAKEHGGRYLFVTEAELNR